jgi:hypothetical protein
MHQCWETLVEYGQTSGNVVMGDERSQQGGVYL